MSCAFSYLKNAVVGLHAPGLRVSHLESEAAQKPPSRAQRVIRKIK